MNWQLPIGAQPDANGVFFRVWAADRQRVAVVLYDAAGKAETATHPLDAEGGGYFAGRVVGIGARTRYMYRLDGDRTRPDPASRSQPDGAHSPSEVVDPAFAWTDAGWLGTRIEDAVIYEVHIGTATPGGTFDSLIERLPYLRELGVTVIEVMPIAEFPGNRNWGYDGVDLFAPEHAYGGATAFKRLINAAHAQGLAVLLDVVYNHFGPDGNYLRDYSAAYFTERHKTPWGDGNNFEDPNVRAFFTANARHWAIEYHLDGLRLDATHAMLDTSTPHIVQELVMQVRAVLPPERHFLLFAEDDRNEAMLVRQQPHGYGLDGMWADDFHHEARSAFAGDTEGYYADYTGSAADIALTLRKGWFYDGILSERKGRLRGTPAADIYPPRFVHTIQNHDQIGNRATGERLNHTISPAAYRAASALLLLTPYTPLLFQGQEWAASTPFLFFTDHNDELGPLVTKGRRDEFAHFSAFAGQDVPDPQADSTFASSKLLWNERAAPDHAPILALYRDLLAARRTLRALGEHHREWFAASSAGDNAVLLRRDATDRNPDDALLLLVLLSGTFILSDAAPPPDGYRWQPLLATEDVRYGGAGVLPGDTFTGVQAVLFRAVPVPSAGA